MRNTFIIAALMALLMLPAAAKADHNGQVISKTSLRAGPENGAPRLLTLRANTHIRLLGCLSGWNWCEVSAAGVRGWVSTGAIGVYYRGHVRGIPTYARRLGVPVISFNERVYWKKHYYDRDFYRARYGRHDRWDHRDCRDRDRDGRCRAWDRDDDRWDRDHDHRHRDDDRDRWDNDRWDHDDYNN